MDNSEFHPTLLIVASNPRDTPQLYLERETREIQNGLRRSGNRFKIEHQFSARPIDLRRALLDYKPTYVHFCGHGEGDEGIAFEDDNRRAKLVTAKALAELFDLFSTHVKCVILNACYTDVQAQAICRHIPFVVGMRRDIGDVAAIEFAVAFYDALAAGESIIFSYQYGCVAMRLTGTQEGLEPQLYKEGNLVKSAVDDQANVAHILPSRQGREDVFPSQSVVTRTNRNGSASLELIHSKRLKGMEVDSVSALELQRIDELSFFALCEALFASFQPKALSRVESDDFGIQRFEAEFRIWCSTTQNYHDERWTLVCKQDGFRNDTGELGRILFGCLAQRPEPDVLVLATAYDIGSLARSLLSRLKKIRVRFVGGEDIAALLEANKFSAQKYFQEVRGGLEGLENEIERYGDGPSSAYSTLGLRSTLLIQKEFPFDASKPRLRIGEPIVFELTIKNLQPYAVFVASVQEQIPRSLHLIEKPPSVELQPLEEKIILFKIATNGELPEKGTAIKFNLVTDRNNSCSVETSLEDIEYARGVHLPFVGREYEFNLLKTTLNGFPCTIAVEGLAGEGKTRLITECLAYLIEIGFHIARVSTAALSDSAALIRSCIVAALELQVKGNDLVGREVLRYYLFESFDIHDPGLSDFLLGYRQPRSSDIDKYINFLSRMMEARPERRMVFIVDDCHTISPVSMESLTHMIQALGERAFYVLSYRSNEISHLMREEFLKKSSEVIELSPLTSSDMTKTLINVSDLPPRIRNKIADASEGNPYCLAESLRLLKENGILHIGKNGKLIPDPRRVQDKYHWPSIGSQNAVDYAHQISWRRYSACLDNNRSNSKEIESVSMLLAAAQRPLPLSLFTGTLGEGILALIDELMDQQLVVAVPDEFSTDIGLYLIHDRMAEALAARSERRKLFWSQINKKLAIALVEFIPKHLLEEYYQKISECFGISGNHERQLEFKFLHFQRSVKLCHLDNIIKDGEGCLELLDRISSVDTDVLHDEERAEILLEIGISQHTQREFDSMNETFMKYEEVSSVSESRLAALATYRCTAEMLSKPTTARETYPRLERSIEALRGLREPNELSTRALLHALNESFIYHKVFEADYRAALSINKEAIALCEQHKLEDVLLWERINRGTLILFTDEESRNILAWSTMDSIWLEVLHYWLDVLEACEASKIVQHIVEANCAVGFIKMFMGFHQCNSGLKEQSILHFQRSRRYAQRYGHEYWLCKLHNHYGVYAALMGDFEESERELKRGLLLADRLRNYYTSWMLHQNLANIACELHQPNEAALHWRRGLGHALGRYFSARHVALKNYNFRQFMRGLILHSSFWTEVEEVLAEYDEVRVLIDEDAGLETFMNLCMEESRKSQLGDLDLYAFRSSYYNTH